MTFDNPIIFFFCALGVFNGFLVSLYFLFFAKEKRLQNKLFGLLVLMLSIRIGKSVYSLFSEEKDLLYMQIGLSACFLIGASLYFYLKSSVENKKIIPRSWKIHYAILILIILSVGVIKPYKTNTSFWNPDFVFFIYSVWGIYLLLSLYVLKDILKKTVTKNEKCTTSELWLIAVLVANILIFIAYIIGYRWFYFIGTLTFSFVFYALLLFFLFKKSRETIFQDIPEKYASKKIEEEEAKSLITQLESLMNEKELYKNSDIKLNDISSKIYISSHRLSQLLNDNLGKSFASYINEYRVNEAKHLIENNDQYTLESIGFDAGFSSKSSFYAIFKKQIGKTPAEYKKEISS
jgi:AraC-like DNA-binding protein